MNINSQIEQTANTRPPQEPKPVHQDDWCGQNRCECLPACMCDEAVPRHIHDTTSPASQQCRLRQPPVNRLWIIVIDLIALARRQMGLVEIKIVQRQKRGRKLKGFSQTLREPAFSCAAAACESYKLWPWFHARLIGSGRGRNAVGRRQTYPSTSKRRPYRWLTARRPICQEPERSCTEVCKRIHFGTEERR